MPRTHSISALQVLVLAAATLIFAGTASAAIHTWRVKEVFSNPSGTVQFIELLDVGVTGTEINVGNGTLTSSLFSHVFAQGQVATPTNGKRYLIGTPDFAALFAALPGAPTPDVTLPVGKVPFFNIAGDTITFSSGDSLIFGAVPTDGINSFDEDVAAPGFGPNSPTNYAGAGGSVDASPPPPPAVPAWRSGTLWFAAALIGVLGFGAISRRATA